MNFLLLILIPLFAGVVLEVFLKKNLRTVSWLAVGVATVFTIAAMNFYKEFDASAVFSTQGSLSSWVIWSVLLFFLGFVPAFLGAGITVCLSNTRTTKEST